MEKPAPIAEMLRTQIELIWAKGRTDLIDRLYAGTIVDHMPVPGQAGGHQGLKQVVDTFRTAMPDLRFDLHGTIACGDIGVDWWTLQGTLAAPLFGVAATGQQLCFGGIDWVRVADGRISEIWHIEEMFQMQAQLGMIAAPGFGAPVAADFTVAPAISDASAAAILPDPAGLTPDALRNLGIARRHIEGLWAAGDIAVAHEVYAEDVVDMNPAPGQRPGIAGIIDVLGWLREAVPDLSMRIDAYAVDGTHAADRWTMTGTHSGADLMGIPARGRRFVMHGMDVVRCNHAGRIDRVWHVEDLAALRHQIG